MKKALTFDDFKFCRYQVLRRCNQEQYYVSFKNKLEDIQLKTEFYKHYNNGKTIVGKTLKLKKKNYDWEK